MSIARSRMDVHRSDGCPSLGWMSVAWMDVHRPELDGYLLLRWMSIARMDVRRLDGCSSLGWMSVARMDVRLRRSDGCSSLGVGWMSVAQMDVHRLHWSPVEWHPHRSFQLHW